MDFTVVDWTKTGSIRDGVIASVCERQQMMDFDEGRIFIGQKCW